MKFEKINFKIEDDSDNVIKWFCKIYHKEYNSVLNELKDIKEELNLENYNNIEVYETYMKYRHTESIEINKNIKVNELNLPNGKYVILCYDENNNIHLSYLKNGLLYGNDDNSLNLKVSKVYKFNDLELYKDWFKNYSFFSDNTFVISEIDFLNKLTDILITNFEESMKYSFNDFKPLSKEELINLSQFYFDSHNIDLNINELIKNKNLILYDNVELKQDSFGMINDGNSNYIKENDKVVATMKLKNNTFDFLILVHELTHNRNQPKGKRNIVSDLLTESISYINEMIACKQMCDIEEQRKYYNILCKTIYFFAYNLRDIYKIINVYKKENDITLEAYNNCYDDSEYQKVMNSFDNYVESTRRIFKDSYYILGFVLAIYMFMEYIKDNDFFYKIEKLNDSINNLKFNDCLNIIGIKDLNDLINKFEVMAKEFKNYLFNSYSENKVKHTID